MDIQEQIAKELLSFRNWKCSEYVEVGEPNIEADKRANKLLNTPVPVKGGVCPECKYYAKYNPNVVRRGVPYKHECPSCKGTGQIPDKKVTIREILEEAMR